VRDAVFFAEKYPLRTAALARELYPDAREIFLVRDFRDMIASILAFNAKRGVQGFGRAGAAGDRDFVLRLGDWADALVRAWERRSERAHLLRYEELVTTPRESARDLLAHLGLGAGDGLLDAMVGALDADLPALADHATAADPRASIGRWRRDLEPELAEACEEAFGGALEAFGYEHARRVEA
jgi:hypothetical protein